MIIHRSIGFSKVCPLYWFPVRMTITHIQGFDNGTCETHTHQWRHTQVETLMSGIWRLTLHAIPCFDKGGHFHMKMFTRTWTAHEDNVHDQQTKPTSEGQFPFFHHVQLKESIFSGCQPLEPWASFWPRARWAIIRRNASLRSRRKHQATSPRRSNSDLDLLDESGNTLEFRGSICFNYQTWEYKGTWGGNLTLWRWNPCNVRMMAATIPKWPNSSELLRKLLFRTMFDTATQATATICHIITHIYIFITPALIISISCCWKDNGHEEKVANTQACQAADRAIGGPDGRRSSSKESHRGRKRPNWPC